MTLMERWFAEERLGRLSLIAFTLAVCFGPTWLIVATGLSLAMDGASVVGAYYAWKKADTAKKEAGL